MENEKQITEISLSDEQRLTIENINLKQEIINFRFNELNAEAMRLREENTRLLDIIAKEHNLDLTDKKISLNGNKLLIE